MGMFDVGPFHLLAIMILVFAVNGQDWEGCLFDPCEASTCKNGATCTQPQQTCEFICTCAEGYTGKICDTKSSPDISGKTCGTSGDLCLNGKCLLNGTGNGIGTVTEVCHCEPGWTGTQCDTQSTQTEHSSPSTSQPKKDSVNNEVTTTTQDGRNNACSTHYAFRPATERTCKGVVTEQNCVFGRCRRELLESERWTGYSYVCDCDTGAQGTYCNHLCCKECGEHGTCTVFEDPDSASSTKQCACEEGWFGSHCETNTLEHKTSTPIPTTEAIVAAIHARFNACSEHYEDRSDAEKTCSGMFWGHECAFGMCRRERVQDENWAGYAYVCECDHGAQGTYCDYTCCLDCGDHGQCAILEDQNSTLSEHCDCNPNYEGERCEVFVPDPFRIQLRENTWYLYVVGACAVAFVLLIIMAVIVPYMMWKHRVILIMKIVHYFKAYEDDGPKDVNRFQEFYNMYPQVRKDTDEREWDAFVSYKADDVDEHFVVHTLYPKLEKELGFKLCLHFRDFVPGETIANNIINAVEGSRRTILILTPRYVESEFTRFEYEKATQEMLRRKHRIIPLLYEDISDVTPNMDTTLKNIIESVTYLEWPHSSSNESSKKEDKFWKRLQLSMPKKKETVSSNSFKNTSSISSTTVSRDCVVNLSNLSESGKISHHPFLVSDAHTPATHSSECSASSYGGRSYSSSGESETTLYSEISDIDTDIPDTLTDVVDVIPTLSE